MEILWDFYLDEKQKVLGWYVCRCKLVWSANRKNKISKKDRKDCKLNCLNSFDPNDEEWPYGWEFLQNDIRNWNYEIIDNIVQGKVFDYIKKKFEDIISEIDELQLRMP